MPPSLRGAPRRRSAAIAVGLSLAGALVGSALQVSLAGTRSPHAVSAVTERPPALAPGGLDPGAIAVGSGSVWIVYTGAGTVTRIASDREQVVTIPVGDEPTGLVYANRSLWVMNRDGRTVTEVDPARNVVVRSIDLGRRTRP